MKILITGICGYVGSRVALRLAESLAGIEILGIDNLARRGAELNLAHLEHIGAVVHRGDVRLSSDLRALPAADWVLDCAANPSVLAGVTPGGSTPEQLMEHNLLGTLNVLEYCRRHGAGLILLSTSRVYSVDALNHLPLRESATRFELDGDRLGSTPGLSVHGVGEEFSTTPPLSLYGASKLASEVLALEYGSAFAFPVWVNRCGVIGGPGQLGRIDQGIFSYWVYSYALRRPLRYIGYGGRGKQLRDCMTAEDLADLVVRQLRRADASGARLCNVGGGSAAAISLHEITQICERYFGYALPIGGEAQTRPFDVPFYVTDNRKVGALWQWEPQATGEEIVLSICAWAAENRLLVERMMA